MDSVLHQFGRLAFRVEGNFWNAYWAPQQQSMKEAILLGSIRLNFVEHNHVLKDGFMTLMQHAFDTAVKDITGQAPSWGPPTRAPERERVGCD